MVKLRTSLLCVTLWALILGCQDNMLNTVNSDITNARNWFERNEHVLLNPTTKNESTRTGIKFTKSPDWNQSKVHQMKNGSKAIEVRLNYDNYLIYSDSNTIPQSEPNVINSMILVEIVQDHYQLYLLKIYPDNSDFEVKNLDNFNFSTIPKAFSGSMLVFDFKENLIGGWKIIDGMKTHFYSTVSTRNFDKGRTSSTSLNCYIEETYWWSQACTRGGDCADPVLIDVTQTIVCELVVAPPSEDPGEGGGGGGGSTCFEEHPYIEGLMVPCEELATITNNITEPCIFQQAENALAENLTNELSSLVQDIFNINDLVNLELSQVNDLPDNESAITTAFKQGDGTLNVEIFFNENTLPSRSQEYIMSTVYHELLHAILFSNYITPDQQHTEMASQYISILSAALLEHFPNLSMNEAIHLSWGGLQETEAWTNLSDTEKNSIIATNIAHKLGQAGQDCN